MIDVILRKADTHTHERKETPIFLFKWIIIVGGGTTAVQFRLKPSFGYIFLIIGAVYF